MIGTSHSQKGGVCQDQISHKIVGDVVCICLSDGAGSCTHAEIGAKIACDTTAEYVARNFDEILNLSASKFQQSLIHRIRTKLGKKASKLNCKKEDMSSTLLFVAICKNVFIAGHIGDGVIGSISNNKCTLVSAPENGEYKNSTYFTTSPDYKSHLRLMRGKTDNIDTFFLLSDGAADALYSQSQQRFSNALLTFANWMEVHPIQEVNLAISLNMSNLFPRITSDDCSIIMAHHLTS